MIATIVFLHVFTNLQFSSGSNVPLLQAIKTEPCETRFIAALPTVPRSGNTLLRALLHHAIGIQTHSVFGEGAVVGRYDGVTIQQVSGANSAHTKIDLCTLLVKCHWPFLPNNIPRFPFFGILRTIREPLGNFGAWIDYCAQKKWCNHQKELADGFANFAFRWASFHKFWDSMDVATEIVEFNHLLDQPVSMLKTIFDRFDTLHKFRARLDDPQLRSLLQSIPRHTDRAALFGSCENGEFQTSAFANVSAALYRTVLANETIARLFVKHNLTKFC